MIEIVGRNMRTGTEVRVVPGNPSGRSVKFDIQPGYNLEHVYSEDTIRLAAKLLDMTQES